MDASATARRLSCIEEWGELDEVLRVHGRRGALGRVKAGVQEVAQAEWGQLRIVLDPQLCKSCWICVEFCPHKALEKPPTGSGPPVGVSERCRGCRLCELLCPDFAISIEEG